MNVSAAFIMANSKADCEYPSNKMQSIDIGCIFHIYHGAKHQVARPAVAPGKAESVSSLYTRTVNKQMRYAVIKRNKYIFLHINKNSVQ